MAIFRKKQSDPPADGGSGDGGGGGDFVPQPEKARTWFEYAKAAADSSNYDYALTCYANGIKLDPGAMSAHEAMLAAGGNYVRSGGKPAGGKELKNIGDGSDIAKFAAAEFAWMKDLENGGLALKALAAAVKADQREFGNWIASRVLLLLRKGKKLSLIHI